MSARPIAVPPLLGYTIATSLSRRAPKRRGQARSNSIIRHPPASSNKAYAAARLTGGNELCSYCAA